VLRRFFAALRGYPKGCAEGDSPIFVALGYRKIGTVPGLEGTILYDPSDFRELASGRRRGLSAAALRAALRVAETPYRLAVAWRNWRYDSGRAEVHRVGVPVVSVGNLTLGGTGKTPMVQWIARWFRARGVRVAILSRGYGAEQGGANDEALELEQRLPDVPHLENPDRVEAARVAVEELEMEALVLDDAFQHRRIARDVDVVLLDALEPVGFEHVFPRGMLREPVRALRRADVVVLTRADAIAPPQREAIRRRVARHAARAGWAEAVHRPCALVTHVGEAAPLESLRDRPVAAFCGLGNPAGFQRTLADCGYRVAGFRTFPDHHRYTRADVESLAAWVEGLGADAAVCTQKDLVKLRVERLGARPLWALSIEIDFLAGQDALESRLAALVG